MRIFIKRLFRKIGYRLVRFLVPCIVISILISCMCLNAFAIVNVTTESGVTFQLQNGSFYSPSLSAGNMIVNNYTEQTTGNVGGIYYVNNGSLRSDLEFTIPVTVINNESFDGRLYFDVATSGVVPYWVNQQDSFNTYFYVKDNNNNILGYLKKSGESNYYFDDEVKLPQSFAIHGIVNATSDNSLFIAVNFDFNRFYPSADNTQINDLHNQEQAIIQSQQSGLNEYFNMVSGLSGMPTNNMQNGLLVVSRMFTQFFDFDNNIRSIFTISLSLGLFAFVVGMTVMLIRGRKK